MKIAPFEIDKFIANIDNRKEFFCVVIYGKDNDVINFRAQNIEKIILKNLDKNFNKVVIDQKYLEDKSSIIEEFQSISMFEGRRLITVKSQGINQEVFKQLQEITQKNDLNNPNFILIIADDLSVSSKLRKLAEDKKNIAAIACYEEKEIDLLQFIHQKFFEIGLKVERNIANLILKRSGSTRFKIENELHKIFLYMGNNKTISEDEIIDLIPNMTDDELMDFATIFADLNKEKTLNILQNITNNGANAIFICRILANYIYKIYKTKVALLQGSNLEIELKKQKIFFMQKAKFIQHINKWSQESVNKTLYDLQILEINLKNSPNDANMLLSKFIICSYANSNL